MYYSNKPVNTYFDIPSDYILNVCDIELIQDNDYGPGTAKPISEADLDSFVERVSHKLIKIVENQIKEPQPA